MEKNEPKNKFFCKHCNSWYYKKIEMTCDSCGKIFYRNPSQYKGKYVFCSKKCIDSSKTYVKRPVQMKEVICEICLKPYTDKKSKIRISQAKICSSGCSAKFTEHYKNGRRCIKCGKIKEIRYFRKLLINTCRSYEMYSSFCGFCRRRHKGISEDFKETGTESTGRRYLKMYGLVR